jgi:hypothetical protein
MTGNKNLQDYLNSLGKGETERISQAEAQAVANYREWYYHFDLLKRQFSAVWDVFIQIEKSIPNWKKSGVYWISPTDPPGLDAPYGFLERAYSYRFVTRIARWNPDGTGIDRGLTIQFNDLLDSETAPFAPSSMEGLPIERESYGKTNKVIAYDRQYPSDKLVQWERVDYLLHVGKNISLDKTKEMLERLDGGKLSGLPLGFEISFSVGTSILRSYNKYIQDVGIGLLYEHDLGEVATALFMLMSKDLVDKGELDRHFPKGDYSRREFPRLLSG